MSLYSRAVLADVPVLYLRLGESSGTAAEDSSGNNLDGVYQNTPTFDAISPLIGDSDTGVTFNGTDEYITVADNALLDPGDTFTLECWVKRTSASSNRVIFDKGTNGYQLYLNDGAIIFGRSDVGIIVTSTTVVPVGVWTHIVVVKSGSAATHLYMNAVDVTGTVTNRTITATATQLNIGRYWNNSSYLEGSLDEVAIYATELLQPRILAHYRAASGITQGIALVEIDWDSGTEYYSFTGVRTTDINVLDIYYEDLVTAIDPIRREVSLFGGAFSSPTASVTFANRDRYFSKKLADNPIRNRELRIKFVDIVVGMTSAFTIFAGDVSHFEMRNGELHVDAMGRKFDDLLSSKVSDTIPMINATNFPNLVENTPETVVPLVFGRITAAWSGNSVGIGRLPGYLIDTLATASGNPFVYVFNARPHGTALSGIPIPGESSEMFYRYGIKTASGTRTTATYNSNAYSVLTFATEQRDAARLNESEITGLISGVTEDDSTSSAPITNPIRALEYFLTNYTDLVSGDFNSALQTDAKAVATELEYDNLFVFGAAITETEMTIRDVIEKFCESFAMQLYTTQAGEVATYIDNGDPDTDTDFDVTDENDILGGSFFLSSNDDIASTLQLNHVYRWSHGYRGDPVPGPRFLRRVPYIIPGGIAETAHLIGRDVNLWYVNSVFTATSIARVYAEYLRPGANWLEFDLPINRIEQCELNSIIGVTHWQGIDNITYSEEVLLDAPSGYWRLGESSGTAAADSSGNNLSGVYQNTPTLGFTGALTSDTDTAVVFNGTDEFVTVADNALLDPGDTFSLEVWFYSSATFPDDTRVILDKGANGYKLFLDAFGYPRLAKNGSNDIVTATSPVLASTWVHLVVTKSGTAANLYVNGINVSAQVASDTIVATASDLNIACGNVADFDFFYGRLDEVAIYPTVLSPNRVLRHYRAGKGIFDSGYRNVPARVTGVEYHVQPRSAHVHVKAFRKVDFTQGRDDFERTVGTTLGSDWSESETAATVFGIDVTGFAGFNRVLHMVALSGSDRGVALRTESYGDNQLAELQLVDNAVRNGNNAVAGICVRGSGTYNNFTGYVFVYRDSTLTFELLKYVSQDINTLGTTLATTPRFGIVTGNASAIKFELRVEGTTITAYSYSSDPRYTGLIFSVTDSAISSGAPGSVFFVEGSFSISLVVNWDNFYARDF